MQQDRPFLGLPLLTIPSDKPTTKRDLLRALYGYFDGNLRSFTVAKLSCSRRNSDHSSRCEDEDGCSRLERKCFLYQVNEDFCVEHSFTYFFRFPKSGKMQKFPWSRTEVLLIMLLLWRPSTRKHLKSSTSSVKIRSRSILKVWKQPSISLITTGGSL